MHTLKEAVKAELLKRYYQSAIGDVIIPGDALFGHVTPFIQTHQLSRQEIVDILKTDERFLTSSSATDFEMKIFAEILYRIMNSVNHRGIQIDAHFANLALHVDLSQSKNLDDILSDKFSLALQSQCMSTMCWFFFMAISAGLFYGGIRGFQRSFEGQSDMGDIFIGAISFGALLLATGLFGHGASELRQFVCNATQQAPQFTQIELTAFYEKHGPSPQVSVSAASAQSNLSEEVPLLPKR